MVGLFFNLISERLILYSVLTVVETEVAPLWDPEKRSFVGLLTTYDYINTLRVCLARGIPMIELSSKTIAEILSSPVITFNNPYFEPLDPDDSIYQLCRLLYNSKSDFAPVVDPITGNIVTILGYLDIVHLVDSAAKQMPTLFSDSIDHLNIVQRDLKSLITLKPSTTIGETLNIFELHGIAGAPVIDEKTGRVINFYYKSDVTFITKANDPDSILLNLRDLTIGEAINYREQLLSSGENLVTTQGLVTCTMHDPVNAILNAMMVYRVTKVVVVDKHFMCTGLVSIKDILTYYLTNGQI